MTSNHTTRDLVAQGVERLAGVSDSPALDAELLLSHTLGHPRARLKSHPEEVPATREVERYLGFLQRRAQGEPLAYIVGRRGFWTLTLNVTPAVLVPRPETELLVERALSLRPDAAGRVADLGTGSGAIALALASERPQWQVTATDVSPEALEVARRNAADLGLRNVEFAGGSWFEQLADRRFHLIVSNPPYIGPDEPEMASPALRYEPRNALTPGVDAAGAATSRAAGLASLLAIVRAAPPHLERGGWLLLEHGSTQAPDVARELVVRGFRHVRSHRDLAGHERMTEAQWGAAPASQAQ
jgi:release factor glutamine methyltransferase